MTATDETNLDPRTPVLVGVGSCHDDAEAAELMARAARQAGDDAGGDLLATVERIAVTKGTWSYPDPGRFVAERIGVPDAETALYELGIPQQTVIDETLAALVAGDVDVALVVGGEAKARDARLRRRSTQADADGVATVVRGDGESWETDQGDVAPDIHRRPEGDLVDPVEIAAGLWAPVEQYALIENALGAAEGRSPDALRDEIAELQARCNAIAQTAPEAAFPAAMTVEEIREFGPDNRPLAFPYGKWHVTQWTVDAAAAMLLCTVDAATRHGVPRDRWVFPLVGLSSSHSLALTRRRELHTWPAMRVLGEAAERRLGHPVARCEHIDLYSCFPVAIRVQQRELGLPGDGAPTITGGMTFAGGPFNNYVFESTVAMARRLRAEGGRGLVTTVSGLLTKPGLAVWSVEADGEAPLLGDLREEAAARTRASEAHADHEGDAVVVTWTVTYDGQEPAELLVVAETDDGIRVIGRSDDRSLMDKALTDGIVGAEVTGRWPSPWRLQSP